jgi:hypothetical protein
VPENSTWHDAKTNKEHPREPAAAVQQRVPAGVPRGQNAVRRTDVVKGQQPRVTTPESFIQLAQMYDKTLEEILTICFESLLQYMITDILGSTEYSSFNSELAYNLFSDIYNKETTYEASEIPKDILQRAHILEDAWDRKHSTEMQETDNALDTARKNHNEEEIKSLIEHQEDLRSSYEDSKIQIRTSEDYLQYCWNVVNDPELVFTSDDNQRLLMLFVKLMSDKLPQAGQVNSRRQHETVSPPPPERERRGAPSAASEAFLAARRTLDADALIRDLTAARSLADGKDNNDAVYHAFKVAFGRMLGETRAHCFKGNSFSGAQSWMQQQAAQCEEPDLA